MVAATGVVAVVAVVAVALTVIGFGLGRGMPGGASAVPHFVDESGSSGVGMTYDGDAIYSTGGGVAVLDCNADRRPDLYIAGGSNPATLYRNEGATGGSLRFTALSDPLTDRTGVIGAYPLDIDGDGVPDLAVLRADGVSLLRGMGSCAFTDATAALGFDGGGRWTTAFSATWEGTATLPTLALGRYLQLEANGAASQDCDENALVRPAAATATTYRPALALGPGFCSLSILFSDWDGSGRRDLRVSNDRQYYIDGQEQLWRVAPGETPRLYTAADGWQTVKIWGMGIASYDVTGDGHPDVYLTSQGDNKLQTLTAGPTQPTYHDIALAKGVTASQPYTGGDTLPSTAWHPEFQDVNNDGRIDLFVSKGNVNVIPDYAAKDPSNLLLGQPDGTFAEGADAAGIVSFDRGRGAALVDLNLDGLLDLVEVNYGQPVELWRNVGAGSATAPAPMGSWLAVRPHQTGPNPDAIGARIEVRAGDLTLTRELTVGGGHAGGQLGWTHLGLGGASAADVRVVWPDGTEGPWQHVTANQFLDLERGAAAPVTWTPPAASASAP